MSYDYTAEGPPMSTGTPVVFGPEYEYDDESRRTLAYWMMGILTLVAAFIGAFIWKNGTENAPEVVSVFLTPVIGLVGTVLGFYFGGNQPER